jgi:hypothetical protein
VGDREPLPLICRFNQPASHLASRDDEDERTTCSPPKNPNADARRSVVIQPQMNSNDTLERRVMTVPDPGQEEHYVLAETEGPETYPLV